MTDAPFDIAVQRHPDFLRLLFSGQPLVDTYIAALHVLSLQAEEAGARRIFMDLRQLASDFDAAQQYEIGREMASSWSHMERVAVVVGEGKRSRLGARIARYNGLNAESFSECRDALHWLISP